MTYATGAGLGTGPIQGNAEFAFTGQVGQGGQLLANYMDHCRRHGGCGEGGGQQNIGQTLMQDGETQVEEGQQLIEEGDVQDGMQLVDEGAKLEMEGAAYEAQGGEGMPGGMMPGGMMPGGMMPGGMMPGGMMPGGMMPGGMMPGGMGGQDPCQGGQYGSPFPTGMGGQVNGGNGFGSNCGGMSVDTANNTITVGDYTIAASSDNAGTLTITNNCTHQQDVVYGDPHIKTANGGVADFQHNNATIYLPNGAEVNITPTGNPTGPNTMSKVVVTYGSQAASINFANGNVQTQNLGGEGYALDESTPAGVKMTASPNGALTLLANGTQIGPNTGNIDADATTGPMGFGPYGTGMAANGGNTAQLVSIITQDDQAMTQMLLGENANAV
jgi:Domain of Unknown Function (DUF1521)